MAEETSIQRITKIVFQIRLAALNEPRDGALGGIRGADYACYRQARRAGLKGTFRTFISSSSQNLDSIVRFSDRDFPVINTKVTPNEKNLSTLVLTERRVLGTRGTDIGGFNWRHGLMTAWKCAL